MAASNSSRPPALIRVANVRRCWWATADPLYRAYHDEEWGRPCVDDRRLFEKLALEGFQAGLSWLTILRKREGFRRAFRAFEPEVVAGFDARVVDRLLLDDAIVRHRGKIEAVIDNARWLLRLQRTYGSLAAFVWSFAPGRTPAPRDRADLQPTTDAAVALAAALRAHGFRFLGPTTVYAFMQAMGLVNDHLVGCTARSACTRERRAMTPPFPRLGAPAIVRECPKSPRSSTAPSKSAPTRSRAIAS